MSNRFPFSQLKNRLITLAKKARPVVALEIALGTALSILLADALGLKYSAAAGITALLTIRETRLKTLRGALSRYIAFALMLLVAVATIKPMGFTTLSFGVFLFVYVALCLALDLSEVVASNAVMASHFLLEGQLTCSLIVNALGLLTVGALLGVAVKMLMPTGRAPLTRYRDEIEDAMRGVLRGMARRALGQCQEGRQDQDCLASDARQMDQQFAALSEDLAAYQQAALTVGDNQLKTRPYPPAYFQMRSRQVSFLKRMWQQLDKTTESYEMNTLLAQLLQETADSFSERNNVRRLLESHDSISRLYDDTPLPRDRTEFENRALLYTVLLDLKTVLEIKRDFIQSVDRDDLDRYWTLERDLPDQSAG